MYVYIYIYTHTYNMEIYTHRYVVHYSIPDKSRPTNISNYLGGFSHIRSRTRIKYVH